MLMTLLRGKTSLTLLRRSSSWTPRSLRQEQSLSVGTLLQFRIHASSLHSLSGVPPILEAHQDEFVKNELRKSIQDSDELGSLEHHADLTTSSLRQKHTVRIDNINGGGENLLFQSIRDFLPKAGRCTEACYGGMRPGFHNAFFRPAFNPAKLLGDGTDTNFLPGPSTIWKHRLWAGGSFRHINSPSTYDEKDEYPSVQLEHVVGIDIRGETRPEKVFVKIRKAINSDISRTIRTSDLGIEETYTICFLRDNSFTSPSTQRRIQPPLSPMYTHKMIPTRNLLFQFSAITHNAHAVHFDRLFAQEEYGLKNCIVHGPLTMVLMLEFFRISMASWLFGGNDDDPNKFVYPAFSFDYKNIAPLYVDEEMTLCCKPLGKKDWTEKEERDELWRATEWLVWIQTGDGDTASLAVRGTLKIDNT